MKKITLIIMALLIVSGSVVFYGCNKDDSESSGSYEPVQVYGNITAPQGMNIDYSLLNVNGGAISTAIPDESGQFNLNLNKDATQLVTVVQENGIPMLLNIIVNPRSDVNIELDVRTTARSLIFLHPAAVVSDTGLSNKIISLIDDLPETDALADLLETKLKSDPDILFQEDPAIRSTITAAVTRLLQLVDVLPVTKSLAKPYVSGDLMITPSGSQSGLSVTASKKSDKTYEIQVINDKKRFVDAFLDDPASGNIGNAFLPSRKSLIDWKPLAPSTEKISAILDVSAHPTTVLYAYSLGALKHGDLLNAPSYQDRTLKPVIYTAVFDFFFPLVDVISGVKGLKDVAPGSDPTGVMAFIINKMNADASLKGQMVAHMETGNFSDMLTTAVKGALQVMLQNPTLMMQYVKGRAAGTVLIQVLTPVMVAPIRIALLSCSGMDVLSAAYGFVTSAWLEKWTLSTGQFYDGNWTGTFYYTATIPQESGPPTVVDESFTLSITLESDVSVPGQPQLLTVTSASCSDQTFGATTPVVPLAPISIALMPASFGSSSVTGMGINIQFPNGSHIATTNFPDGAFTVDTDGHILASTDLVSEEAFHASGTIENSNLPGSGPGGYAYNWCKFTSWSLVRQ